jgi:hypothetical protein
MASLANAKLINTTKGQIIDMLKYVYHDKNSSVMEQFLSLSQAYEKSKKLKAESKTREETPEELVESDAVLDEIADIKNKNLCCIFKKINVLFTALSSLLKFMIIKVNDERYQKAVDEKIKFPRNLDALIVVIGCYSDAFSKDFQEELFNIVELHSFAEMSAIANINHNMIAFVANDKINVDLLTVDYVEFAEMVQNFACGVLDVNTDFDHDSVVEWIDKDADQIEEDVDAVDVID